MAVGGKRFSGSARGRAQALKVARVSVRVTFIAQLLLGIGLWTGRLDGIVPVHISVGILFVLGLWTIAALGATSGANRIQVVVLLLWGLMLPLYGLAQERLVVGDFHWTVQVIHLALGVAGIAQAEALGRTLEDSHP